MRELVLKTDLALPQVIIGDLKEVCSPRLRLLLLAELLKLLLQGELRRVVGAGIAKPICASAGVWMVGEFTGSPRDPV